MEDTRIDDSRKYMIDKSTDTAKFLSKSSDSRVESKVKPTRKTWRSKRSKTLKTHNKVFTNDTFVEKN